MNVINIIHNKAIEFADEAIIAKHKGNPMTAKELYLKAFQLEREAALKTPIDNVDAVPRHVLLRSAASLALLSEQFEEADKLISLGLLSKPPQFIKKELMELSKEVKKKKAKRGKVHVIDLVGLFTFANAAENEIKIQDENQPYLHTLIAPSEVIKEIVQKHFLEKVKVKVSVSDSGILLMTEMKKAA